MFISKIPSERLGKAQEATLVLRDGQIVQGKINKIYPNNRAEVQIGSHRFVAEIKTPLEVGERYIFTVGAKNDSAIQLQVIGNQLSGIKSVNIISLLAQLQIKINDTSVAFAQSLLNDRIPFSKRDLVQALNLIDLVGNSRDVQSMLKHMITQKIPLEENVLRALLAVNQQNLSHSLKNALKQLNSTRLSPAQARLQSLIGNLLQPSTPEQIASLPKEQVRQMLQSFQLLRLLPLTNEQEIEAYTNRLFQEANARIKATSSLVNDIHVQSKKAKQETAMLQLIRQYKPISHVANQIIHEFELPRNKPLSSEQFSALKQKITNELLPLLPNNEQLVVRNLLNTNNQANLQSLQTLLQTFQSQHFYSVLMDALMLNQDEALNQNNVIQQRFLLNVQQLLQTLGTQNEAAVKQFPTQIEHVPASILTIQQSIKSLLIHVLNEERAPLENLQQLVHHINGLQLQTREENNLLQAYLQLPGAKLGLPEDLFMQFESRKTKDDQIDTEFCRILFFLQLHHLKETIIDMNIQKRVISLTIYNEFSERLPNQIEPLRELLNSGLERLDYKLSNVRFKPLQDEPLKQQVKVDFDNSHTIKREGFDFRI